MPHGEPSQPRVVGGTRTTLDHGPCLVRLRRPRGRGRCPSPRRGDASAVGISSPADVRNPRPSQRAKTYSSAVLDVQSRGRANPRTAAPPRTSSRTPHGPAGPALAIASSTSASRTSGGSAHSRWWPGRTRAPPRGWSCRSGRRRLGTRCRRRTPAPPRARWTCTRRRGAARRSRCRRALGSTLRRARRAAPRARRCAMRARAADRCPDRLRRARQGPDHLGSADRPLARRRQGCDCSGIRRHVGILRRSRARGRSVGSNAM